MLTDPKKTICGVSGYFFEKDDEPELTLEELGLDKKIVN